MMIFNSLYNIFQSSQSNETSNNTSNQEVKNNTDSINQIYDPVAYNGALIAPSLLGLGNDKNDLDFTISKDGYVTSRKSDLRLTSNAGKVYIKNRDVMQEIDDLKTNQPQNQNQITSQDNETKKTIHLDNSTQKLEIKANSVDFVHPSTNTNQSLNPVYSKPEELIIPQGLNQGFRDDTATHPDSNTPKTWEMQFLTNTNYGNGSAFFFTTGYLSAGDPNQNLISVYFNDKPPNGGLVVYTSGAGQEGFVQKDVNRNLYADGKYHHLVCTLDPATRIFNIFIDKQLIFTHTFSNDLQVDHDSDGVILGMNGHDSSFGDSINGKIKNFYLYDKILTQAEINSRYDASFQVLSYTNLNNVGQINNIPFLNEINALRQEILTLRDQMNIMLKGDYVFPYLKIGKTDYNFLIRPADVNSQDGISDVNRKELYIMAPIENNIRKIITSHSNQDEFIVNGQIKNVNGLIQIQQLPSGNQNDDFTISINPIGAVLDTAQTTEDTWNAIRATHGF